MAHVSVHKEVKSIHAEGLEEMYRRIEENSVDVGMKINERKTQLLCMSQAINYEVNSFINIGGERIWGGEELKILGFHIGKRGDMGPHVKPMKKQFAAAVWMLRHLRRARLDERRLTAVYVSMIRSVLEYASVVYGSMLTAGQSRMIERMQANALKTIWGWNKSYRECLELSGLTTLEARREENMRRFATKAAASERYSRWFPERRSTEHELRRTEKYQVRFARHERLKKAPIYAMRRLLNEDAMETRSAGVNLDGYDQ